MSDDEAVHEKSEHCTRCKVSMEATGDRWKVIHACDEFRREHRHDIVAWICWHHDMGIQIAAIFDNELDALRHAVGSGYLKVAAVESGEIGQLP